MSEIIDTNLLVHKVESIQSELIDVKHAIKEVALALNKLTLVEERQEQTSKTIKRLFEKTDSIESRVSTLEKSEVKNGQVINWVVSAASASFGMLAMYLIKVAG